MTTTVVSYSPDVTTRVVFGQYLKSDGKPATGSITFVPSSRIVDPYDSVILSGPLTVSLDAEGKFSVALPCTDNILLQPVNWHYEVRTRTGGTKPTTIRIYLPLEDGSDIDISILGSANSITTPSGPTGVTTTQRGPAGPQGLQGIQGPTGSSAETYVHNQGSPSDTWTINHNLGYFPNVSVVDSAGTVVEGDTAWPNAYTIVVSFESAFSGKAYLS